MSRRKCNKSLYTYRSSIIYRTCVKSSRTSLLLETFVANVSDGVYLRRATRWSGVFFMIFEDSWMLDEDVNTKRGEERCCVSVIADLVVTFWCCWQLILSRRLMRLMVKVKLRLRHCRHHYFGDCFILYSSRGFHVDTTLTTTHHRQIKKLLMRQTKAHNPNTSRSCAVTLKKR